MATFWKRTFSTVVLLALLGGSVFLPYRAASGVFSVLAILLSYAAVYECSSMLNQGKFKMFSKFSAFALALTVLGMLAVPEKAVFAILVFLPMLWILILFTCNRPDLLRALVSSIASYFLFLIPIFGVVCAFKAHPEDPVRWILLYLILVTKAGDIGAYVVGSLCNAITKGRNHKLIPSVSPGKSWEGCAGGLILSIIVSCVVFPYCRFRFGTAELNESWFAPVLFGAVLYVFGAIGDLAESSIKRSCGCKDSGRWLPGIGGVFDLVDSLMINASIFLIYFEYQVVYHLSF